LLSNTTSTVSRVNFASAHCSASFESLRGSTWGRPSRWRVRVEFESNRLLMLTSASALRLVLSDPCRAQTMMKVRGAC
jgi:hypothetical protein